MKEKRLEAWVREELQSILPNIIWCNDAGEYEVFGRYKIVRRHDGYHVMCRSSDVGIFGSSKTAVSWCVADKYQSYNLAREILRTDNRLSYISADIITRMAAADRSNRAAFKENIDTKLETKILRKKQLEEQLNKYVNSAKYLQQRGFDNEIARSSRTTKNQTSR